MEVDRLPDGRPLAALSLAELREACGSRGLSKGGSRKDLSERLKLRLELERLREESTRKAKAKEDVVPNIGLQDTAVGQSDIVRQYLEAQQRRLELFAQLGQTGDQQQQLQSLQGSGQPTAAPAAAAELAPASSPSVPTSADIVHQQHNHAQPLGGPESRSPKGPRPAAGVSAAKTKGIATRKGKSAVAVVETASPARGTLASTPLEETELDELDETATATAHSSAKSAGKATRSRVASNNVSGGNAAAAASASKFEVLPSPTKKTRVVSTPTSTPTVAAIEQTPISGYHEDQLVPSLPALQTKRRRGAVQPPPNTISRAEPVTAVKSSPRATKTIASSKIEPQTPPPQPAPAPVTVSSPSEETSPPVKRGRGRPRKTAVVLPHMTVSTPPASTVGVGSPASAETIAVQSAEQPVGIQDLAGQKVTISPASSAGNIGSGLRERGGKDKDRQILIDEAKPPKVQKTQSQDDQSIAGTVVTATKSVKAKSEKSPTPEPVKSAKDKVQDPAKSVNKVFATKRSERATNRAENQLEALREVKEGRPTRVKRPRSQDDMIPSTPSGTDGAGGIEPNKKLNKSNRQQKDDKCTAVVAIKSNELTVPAEEVLPDNIAVQQLPPVEDPIEAALLALHGGCDDPQPLKEAATEFALSQTSQEAAAPANAASSRPSKGRGGSHRETRTRPPSVERTAPTTKGSAVAAQETHLYVASDSPSGSPKASSIDKKATAGSSMEMSSVRETSTSHDIKEMAEKSPPSGSQSPLKAASASPPSERSETRRSDRNQRETRKRSKVENIVQRLARREGRCSNTSVSSTDSIQAVGLREPFVLLERTELTGDQLDDTGSTVVASKATSGGKADQTDIKIASPSKEAEARLQGNRAKDDEGRSPDTERRTTPPRSKRPRRENGAIDMAKNESASETPLTDLSADAALTCEPRSAKSKTAAPASSTSIDDCVLRLLGASPVKASTEAISETVSLTLTARPTDSSNDSKQAKQQEQHSSLDVTTGSQVTLRRTRRHASTDNTPVDTAETSSSPPHKQAKNTSSKEKHEQSIGLATKESSSTSMLYPMAVPTPAAVSCGRRDSVEAAVAALIGEPYEEAPICPPDAVVSSKSSKGSRHALHGEAAEKASTVPSTASPHSSKVSSKKYSSTTTNATGTTSTSSRDRTARRHHKDDSKVKQGSVERETGTTESAAAGGCSPGSGARSSRNRSSRHSRHASVEDDVEKDGTYDAKGRSADPSPPESCPAGLTVDIEVGKVHRVDSEKQPSLAVTSASAEGGTEQKSERGNADEEVQAGGYKGKAVESGTPLSASILSRERRARRKATTDIASDNDLLQSVQHTTKSEDANRLKVTEPAAHGAANEDKSTHRIEQIVDAIPKTTAVDTAKLRSSIDTKDGTGKTIGVDLLVECRKVTTDEVPLKDELELKVQSVAADQLTESKVEVEDLAKRATQDKQRVGSLSESVGTSTVRRKSGDVISSEEVQKESTAPTHAQGSRRGTRTASVDAIADILAHREDTSAKSAEKVEALSNEQIETKKSIESHKEPEDPPTEEAEPEEEVCLILGDPDDDDDVPEVCLSKKPSEDVSAQQKSDIKAAGGDATPDIASVIERETATGGNVSGAGDPDDLWEAVFCADHDQNAALERSVWNEAENSHRSHAVNESSREQPAETKQESQVESYSASDNTVRLPDKFQPNVESAVASILDLQDPLDLEVRPSSSLSSVANDTDRQEALGGPDAQGPSAPDVDSAVQGLLDEAPSFDEVVDADPDEPVGIVAGLCIHDDENAVEEELVSVDAQGVSAIAEEHGEISRASETFLVPSSPLPFETEESLVASVESVVQKSEDCSIVPPVVDSGVVATESIVDATILVKQNEQQTTVDNLEQAANEAARRLSAEVRSVTGDVVESVATTSRLVEDAAGVSRAPGLEEVKSDISKSLHATDIQEDRVKGSPWTTTDTGPQSPPSKVERPRPPSSGIGHVDDLKGSVNLSEESSSDSESDDEAEDDRTKQGGAQLAVAGPTSVVEGSGDQIKAEVESIPSAVAQSTQNEIEEKVSDERTCSDREPETASTADTVQHSSQPDLQDEQRQQADEEKDIRDTKSDESPPPTSQMSDKEVESSVASIVEGMPTTCAEDPSTSPLAHVSGELPAADEQVNDGKSCDGNPYEAASTHAEPDDKAEPQGTLCSVSDEDQRLPHAVISTPLEPVSSASPPRPDRSASYETNEGQIKLVAENDPSIGATAGPSSAPEHVLDQHSPAAALGSTDSQYTAEESSADVDQEHLGGDRPDSGSVEYKQTSSFKAEGDSAASLQPGDTSTPADEAGPSQMEETREATCYSEDNQSDVNKDLSVPVDKPTPPECTTSGIRGSTTSSSLSEQSPCQDSPSCQPVPSLEVAKPNSLVSYDLDSDSDSENDTAGPSEATAKDVPVMSTPEQVQSTPAVERPLVDDLAAGSSDDPVVATANRVECDPPRHSGADVSSSLRASLITEPTNAGDGDAESPGASSSVEQTLPSGNKKSEVTSSSDQPAQDTAPTNEVGPSVEASCEPSAEAAAEVEPELEAGNLPVNQDVDITEEQGHQADASSSDDKSVPDARLSDSCGDEAEPEVSSDRDQLAQHQHAASSSSDAALDSGPYNSASSTLTAGTDQVFPPSNKQQTEPGSVPTEDEACSSSDKHMQSTSSRVESRELIGEASSSGDASHGEGQREDVQSSTEACTGQQPVCRATSSDDIAMQKSTAGHAESSFQGGTPLSSAASTPGAYVGSSSPPAATIRQDDGTESEQLHPDASASEPTGGASSSSDKKPNNVEPGMPSSPSSNDSDQSNKEETMREARAISEGAEIGSEISAVLGEACSSRRLQSDEQRCAMSDERDEAQSAAASESDEAESNRDSNVGASHIAAEENTNRVDLSDTTKSGISSSEERDIVSGNPVCQIVDPISSAATPSDTGNDESGAALIQLSEESGRGRCQSTSEQRIAPRASPSSEDDDEAVSGDVVPEGSLACTSSNNSTARSVDPLDATDDDRDISSSNNTNNRNESCAEACEVEASASAESGTEKVSASTAGPLDKDACGERVSGGDDKIEQEHDSVDRTDCKQDISSSQGISSGGTSEMVNSAADADTKVSATSGGNCSSSSNTCAITERSQEADDNCRGVADQIQPSAVCLGRSDDIGGSEADQLASSSVPSSACSTSGSAISTVCQEETGQADGAEGTSSESPANKNESNEEVEVPHEADSTPERDEGHFASSRSEPVTHSDQTGEVVEKPREDDMNQESSLCTMTESPLDAVVEDVEMSVPSVAHVDQDDSRSYKAVRSSDGSGMRSLQACPSSAALQNPMSNIPSQASNAAASVSDQAINFSEPIAVGSDDVAEQVNEAEDAQPPSDNLTPSVQRSNNDEASCQISEDPTGQNKGADKSMTSTDMGNSSEMDTPDEERVESSILSQKASETATSDEKLSKPSTSTEKTSEMVIPDEQPLELSIPSQKPSEEDIPEERSSKLSISSENPSETAILDKKSPETAALEEEPLEPSIPSENPSESVAPDEKPPESTSLSKKPSETATPEKEPSESSTPTENPSEKVALNEEPLELSVQSEKPSQDNTSEERSSEPSILAEMPPETAISDEKPSQPAIPSETPLGEDIPEERSSEPSIPSEQPSEPATCEEKPSESSSPTKNPLEKVVLDEEPLEPSVPSEQPSETATPEEKPLESSTSTEKPSEKVTLDKEPLEPSIPSEQPSEIATPEEKPSESSTSTEKPSEKATLDEEPLEPSIPSEQPSEIATPEEKPLESSTSTEKPSEKVTLDEEPLEPSIPSEQPSEIATPEEKPSESSTSTEKPSEKVTLDEEPLEPSIPSEQPSEIATPEEKPSESSTSTEKPSEKATLDEESLKPWMPSEQSSEEGTPKERPSEPSTPTEKTSKNDEEPLELSIPSKNTSDGVIREETSSESTSLPEKPSETCAPQEKPSKSSTPTENPSEKVDMDEEPLEPSVQSEKPSQEDIPEKRSSEEPISPKKPLETAVPDKKSPETAVLEEEPLEPSIPSENPSESDAPDERPPEPTSLHKKPSEMSTSEEKPSESSNQAKKPSEKATLDEEPLEPSIPSEQHSEIATPEEKPLETSTSTEKPSEKVTPGKEPREPSIRSEKPLEGNIPEERSLEPSNPSEQPSETATCAEKPSESSSPTKNPLEKVALDEEPLEPSVPSEQPSKTASPEGNPSESSTATEKHSEKVTLDEEPLESSVPSEQPSEEDAPKERLSEPSTPTEKTSKKEEPLKPSIPSKNPSDGVIPEETSSGPTCLSKKPSETCTPEERPSISSTPTENPSEKVDLDEEPLEPSVESEKPPQDNISEERSSEPSILSEKPLETTSPEEKPSEPSNATEKQLEKIISDEGSLESPLPSEKPSKEDIPEGKSSEPWIPSEGTSEQNISERKPSEQLTSTETTSEKNAPEGKPSESSIPSEMSSEKTTPEEKPSEPLILSKTSSETDATSSTSNLSETATPTEKPSEGDANEEKPSEPSIPTDEPSQTDAPDGKPPEQSAPTEKPTVTVTSKEEPSGPSLLTEIPSETVDSDEKLPDALIPTRMPPMSPARSNKDLSDKKQPLPVQETKLSKRSPDDGKSSPTPGKGSVEKVPANDEKLEATPCQNETPASKAVVPNDTDEPPTQDDTSSKDRGDLNSKSPSGDSQITGTNAPESVDCKRAIVKIHDDETDVSLDPVSNTLGEDVMKEGTTGSELSSAGDKKAKEDSVDASTAETTLPTMADSQLPKTSAGSVQIAEAN